MQSNIKIDLLNFPRSSLFFAEHGINKHLISWNKVILLHGPPGTGKTSLCKVKMICTYQYTAVYTRFYVGFGPEAGDSTSSFQIRTGNVAGNKCSFTIFEVLLRIWKACYENVSAHKGVFGQCRKVIHDRIIDIYISFYISIKGVLVMLLIDEVESLTAARSTSKDEPSDAVRVVNALLTQLGLNQRLYYVFF